MPISSAHFKDLMSFQCSSVSIISSMSSEGSPVGLTASSLQSVSASPPTVLFCVSNRCHSRAVFSRAEYIGVSLLSKEVREIADRYSKAGTTRFIEGDYFIGERGVPLIRNAVFNMVGKVVRRLEVLDTTVFFLEIVSASTECSNEPLLYFRREFRKL